MHIVTSLLYFFVLIFAHLDPTPDPAVENQCGLLNHANPDAGPDPQHLTRLSASQDHTFSNRFLALLYNILKASKCQKHTKRILYNGKVIPRNPT
jgi:hypothetical protein